MASLCAPRPPSPKYQGQGLVSLVWTMKLGVTFQFFSFTSWSQSICHWVLWPPVWSFKPSLPVILFVADIWSHLHHLFLDCRIPSWAHCLVLLLHSVLSAWNFLPLFTPKQWNETLRVQLFPFCMKSPFTLYPGRMTNCFSCAPLVLSTFLGCITSPCSYLLNTQPSLCPSDICDLLDNMDHDFLLFLSSTPPGKRWQLTVCWNKEGTLV